MADRLTQKKINAIQATEKTQYIADGEVAGLSLRVGTSGKKVWFLLFYDGGKRGKRKIGDASALTVEQARDMARDFQNKLAHGESIRKEKPTDKLTLGRYLNDYYFPYARLNFKSATEIIRAITAAFGDYFNEPVEDITPLVVEKWRTCRREAGVKATTVNRVTAYFKAGFNYGVKSGLLEENPIAKVTPLKERDSKKIVRYLSPDERERLENALVERERKIRQGRESANEWRAERGYTALPDINGEFTDYLRPVVLLSLCTGIRRGAMFALRWRDIDFDAQTITLNGEDAKSGKTSILLLSDDAADILSSWRSQSASTGADDLIFPSPKTGGQMCEIKTAWTRLVKEAGIDNFRWHDMRHDFASQLVMKGVDLNTVRELLCHASLDMTMRYAHLAPENKLMAVQLLNRRTKGDKIIGRIRKASA